VTEQLRRQRPYQHTRNLLSDSASNTSEEYLYYHSSPIAAPTFSDFRLDAKKGSRSRLEDLASNSPPRLGRRKRLRSSSSTATTISSSSSNAAAMKNAPSNRSWRQDHRLTESSPVFQRPRLPSGNMHQSFVSGADAILEPRSYTHSSNFTSQCSPHIEAVDLPMYSFDSRPVIPSSPPRTPSPNSPRRARRAEIHHKETGADLLLYLANSPSRSPAPNHRRRRNSGTGGNPDLEPPCTPPSQHTLGRDISHHSSQDILHSSFLSTPPTGITNGNANTDSHRNEHSTRINPPQLSTPGQNFNFADFVNVTPSPAQAPWDGRTPASHINKTPVALARTNAARRCLNFDALVPPMQTGTDAGIQHSDENLAALRDGDGVNKAAGNGLALDLGDKLMPRT
jgi:hypothetical protein